MDIESISFFKSHWQDIKDFFNSVFFTAIAGSLAGAFAGAYGAQRIVEKGKNREELLKEIRNTNATIMVAFGICNTLLSLKKQHVKSLKDKFYILKKDFLEFQKKRQLGQISGDTIFYFQADFQTISPILLPMDILQKQVFEKMSLIGRPLSLATTLGQTVHELNLSIEKRNQLIDSYKANSPIPIDQLAPLYFGLPQSGGHVNQEYPDSLDAIYGLTDDGIFFSQLLCQDLVEHGEKIAVEFKNKYAKGAPTISKPDFTKAEMSGLMPKAESYSDWTTMFMKESNSKTGK